MYLIASFLHLLNTNSTKKQHYILNITIIQYSSTYERLERY